MKTPMRCPFCGGSDITPQGDGCDGHMLCEDCGAQGPTVTVGCRDEDDKIDLDGEALAQWNARRDLRLVLEIEPCAKDVQDAVCRHFGVSNAELIGPDRHQSITVARHIAMYICRHRLKGSFPEIGPR